MRDTLFDVENMNVLVIGGSGGIGWAVAKAFIQRKAHVVVADKKEPEETSRLAAYFSCDLSSHSSIEQLISDVRSVFETIDTVVNVGGVTLPGASVGYDKEDWEQTLDINLNSVFFVSQLTAKWMIEKGTSGSIINFSSIGGKLGFANNPSYAASKGGVEALTRALAAEWGAYGIRVNSIVPGYTETQMNINSLQDAEKRLQRAQRSILGRWANPNELAGPTLFLASRASSFITGSSLDVDGGWLAKGF